VDFAGDTVAQIDPPTGDTRAAHIFVAALGGSNFTDAEARWSKVLPSRNTATRECVAGLNGRQEPTPAVGDDRARSAQAISAHTIGIFHRASRDIPSGNFRISA
jgi:hypothetical protein